MIQPEEFIEEAKEFGFKWYSGVPCSFLTPLINYVINSETLSYFSSVNEGDALALAAGATIGGKRAVVMMQNSGLGNALNPLASLTYTFRIPILLICTLRGDPELKDEPQHELMGQITGELLSSLKIPWEWFPTVRDAISPILQRVEQYMNQESRPYALIMRKGAVAHHVLQRMPVSRCPSVTPHASHPQKLLQDSISSRITRRDALCRIIELTNEPNIVIIATTGYTGRELFALGDCPNHFYMVGSMGCASSLGLGLSLARPDLKVIIIDGDGSALMRMSNFASIGTYGRGNLIHILLDNEAYDSTGGQATISSNVRFSKIADACGYGISLEGNDLSLLDKLLVSDSLLKARFGHLKIRAEDIEKLPRPSLSPEIVLQRLIHHISSI